MSEIACICPNDNKCSWCHATISIMKGPLVSCVSIDYDHEVEANILLSLERLKELRRQLDETILAMEGV